MVSAHRRHIKIWMVIIWYVFAGRRNLFWGMKKFTIRNYSKTHEIIQRSLKLLAYYQITLSQHGALIGLFSPQASWEGSVKRCRCKMHYEIPCSPMKFLGEVCFPAGGPSSDFLLSLWYNFFCDGGWYNDVFAL